VLAGPALLFCPASRPDRIDKAVAAADTALVDLEDAVPAAGKLTARQAVRDALRANPDRFITRVNARATPWHDEDVAMLRDIGASRLVLSKTETAQDLEPLADFNVIALCETVAGVVNADAIATAGNCAALFFGAEDLTADLGGGASRDKAGHYHRPVEYAAARVLFAAAAHGKLAISPVYLSLDDNDGLRTESEAACDMGYSAKGCVHPRQVPVVRAAFAPTPEQIDWATRLLTEAGKHDAGVFRYEGQMVDGPVFAQARRILARAGGPWTSS
jgi:citrate lyase subunit beta/citryl-CoA lyase